MSTTPHLEVRDEQVAAYHELLASLARRYNGFQNAEYDDLFQEGSIAVFFALRKGQLPSRDLIAKTMLKWVNKCGRAGLGYDDDPLLRRVQDEELLS